MPDIVLTERTELSIPDLQTASDEFFQARAKMSVPGKLAELALVDYPTEDRPDNDPTLLENKFFVADIANRPFAEHEFLRKVGNLKAVIGDINQAVDEYGLDQYPEITTIMPHIVMQDAITIPMLIGQSKLGEGRTVEDNYIIVSRLIPYIQYMTPFKKIASLIHPQQPTNSFRKHVIPMGNVVQIFPETQSTEPLFAVYPKEIARYNVRALREMEEYKKTQAKKGNQQILFLPPSASRTKGIGHGKDKKYEIEYVSSGTVRRLYKDHKKGTPIWPIGINYNPALIYLPGFPPQQIRLHCVRPIMPSDKPLPEEVFEQLLMAKLLETATSVTRRPVYQKPRPNS